MSANLPTNALPTLKYEIPTAFQRPCQRPSNGPKNPANALPTAYATTPHTPQRFAPPPLGRGASASEEPIRLAAAPPELP